MYSHPPPIAGISYSRGPANREPALGGLNNQWEKGYLGNDTHPKAVQTEMMTTMMTKMMLYSPVTMPEDRLHLLSSDLAQEKNMVAQHEEVTHIWQESNFVLDLRLGTDVVKQEELNVMTEEVKLEDLKQG